MLFGNWRGTSNFCQFLAKPGVTFRRFGRIIEEHATKLGFTTVRAFCGHGIHQLFHATPTVPHYSSKPWTRAKNVQNEIFTHPFANVR